MTDENQVVPLTEEESISVFMAVNGLARWSADAAKLVARAVRQNELTLLQRVSLARLIEGTHPKQLRLIMHGQGNDPTLEEADTHFRRAEKVGSFVQSRIDANVKKRDALIDAEIEFGISDSTARRDYMLWRLVKGLDEPGDD